MSSLSLDASIRTCKVNSSEASRIESDRFLNPNNMVCIPWNGYNLTGQPVCADSWYTKTPGCNSAMDRVTVENALRPQYGEYINLNLQGVQGNIYGNVTAWNQSGDATSWADSRNNVTGQFGNQWKSTNIGNCSLNAYDKAMAEVQQANRGAAYANNSYMQNGYRQNAGNAGY